MWLVKSVQQVLLREEAAKGAWHIHPRSCQQGNAATKVSSHSSLISFIVSHVSFHIKYCKFVGIRTLFYRSQFFDFDESDENAIRSGTGFLCLVLCCVGCSAPPLSLQSALSLQLSSLTGWTFQRINSIVNYWCVGQRADRKERIFILVYGCFIKIKFLRKFKYSSCHEGWEKIKALKH